MIRTRIAATAIAALFFSTPAFAAPIPTTNIQFNPVGVASGYSIEQIPATPYDNSTPPGPVGLPAHTIVNLHGSEPILIIPLADYRDLWTAAGDETIATRAPQITAIARHDAPVPATNLPLLPPAPATNDLVTLSKSVNFNGGTGFRAVVRYAQDPSPVQPSHIRYRYQGVTVDGNYLVSFDLLLQVNWTEDIAIDAAARVIGAKASTDFTPTLDQIDAALSTLMIRPPESAVPPAAVPPTPPADLNPPAQVPTPPTDAPPVQPEQPALPPADPPVQPVQPALPPSTSPQAPTQTGSNQLALVGPTWQWTSATMAGTPFVTVADPSRYTITFQPDGIARLRVDCNLGSGKYTVIGDRFELGGIATTRVGCPADSLDSQFLGMITSASGYRIQGRELLVQVGVGINVIEMHFSPAS